jgi:hypothetical protein
LILDRLKLPAAGSDTADAATTAGTDDPEALLGWALQRLSADRLHTSGLLDRLVELANEQTPGTADAAAVAVPVAATTGGEERSVDDINAELNALFEASGLDLD